MTDYESQFPIESSERPLRFDAAEIDPAKRIRDQLARIYREQREMSDQVLVHLAQTMFQLSRICQDLKGADSQPDSLSLNDALEIIRDNLQDALDQHAVRVQDLTDEPWNAQMLAEVALRGHEIREDISEPRVAFMELPVVYRGERLIAKGAAMVEAPKRS